VPERIDDPAQTPAVLIANGGLLRGASVDRLPHHGVGVIGRVRLVAPPIATPASVPPTRAGSAHPKLQHRQAGRQVTIVLLYDGGVVEEDAVPRKLVMTRQVRDWLRALRSGDPVTRRLVAEAIDHLLDDGPALGRPLADRITGSRLHNLKELRPGSSGASEVRILFIFDPARARGCC
jgi:hypothetical protein